MQIILVIITIYKIARSSLDDDVVKERNTPYVWIVSTLSVLFITLSLTELIIFGEKRQPGEQIVAAEITHCKNRKIKINSDSHSGDAVFETRQHCEKISKEYISTANVAQSSVFSKSSIPLTHPVPIGFVYSWAQKILPQFIQLAIKGYTELELRKIDNYLGDVRFDNRYFKPEGWTFGEEKLVSIELTRPIQIASLSTVYDVYRWNAVVPFVMNLQNSDGKNYQLPMIFDGRINRSYVENIGTEFDDNLLELHSVSFYRDDKVSRN